MIVTRGVAALLGLAAVLSASGPAAGQDRVSFALDWVLQGPQAPFVAARGMGAFRRAGLDVTIDPGSGSQKTIERVATGTYDLGYGDVSSMIEYNARHPEQPLRAIYMVLNTPPLAVISLRRHGIATPADLRDAAIGAPAGDAARRLWPLFARGVGLSADAVRWVNVAPQLREVTLVRGDVKAIVGFHFTSWLSLTDTLGVPERELVVFRYADHGVDLYGNAVMGRTDWLAAHGDVARRFLAGLTEGLRLALHDPRAAVTHLKAAEPLVNVETETRRLELARVNMLTAEVRARGLGGVDPARLERCIDQVVSALALPVRPGAAQVFTDAYLPPAAARRAE